MGYYIKVMALDAGSRREVVAKVHVSQDGEEATVDGYSVMCRDGRLSDAYSGSVDTRLNRTNYLHRVPGADVYEVGSKLFPTWENVDYTGSFPTAMTTIIKNQSLGDRASIGFCDRGSALWGLPGYTGILWSVDIDEIQDSAYVGAEITRALSPNRRDYYIIAVRNRQIICFAGNSFTILRYWNPGRAMKEVIASRVQAPVDKMIVMHRTSLPVLTAMAVGGQKTFYDAVCYFAFNDMGVTFKSLLASDENSATQRDVVRNLGVYE